MSMTKLAEVTVGAGGQSSINFTNIPQTFTDLQLVLSTRNADSGYFGYIGVGFNGVTTNLSQRRLRGNGSTASSGTNTYLEMAANASGTTANTFSNAQVYISNYAGSTNKSVSLDWVMENNVAEAYQQIAAGIWSSTAAITSIQVYGSSNFVQYSTATLYGVSKVPAAGIQPKATGGDVYQNGAYTYHVFNASGTFTPISSLSADVLVVAGGGAGGESYGAGGGAGGLNYLSSQSISSAQTITIGAGGVNNSTSGSNTSFGATTSIGGGLGGANGRPTGATGGSGGGGGYTPSGTIIGAGGTGTSGQGNNGGSAAGSGNSFMGLGGGGGAGGPGATASGGVGGAGGAGVSTYSSWATATSTGVNVSGTYYYAGGGSGNGTGGASAPNPGGTAWNAAGPANTGNGGGGDSALSGGSGVVIIRYA